MALKSCEKTDTNTVKLVIEVDAEIFGKACEQAYRKKARNITVPGFRKGKAPRRVIEKMYGEGFFYEDAVNEIYPDVYAEAVEEAGIDPVDKADVQLEDVSKDGFCFTATVTVAPEAEIGEYKGIKAQKTEASVDDQEVDDEIQRRRERSGRLVTTDRAAASGDTVVIDFEGFLDSVPFEGGKGENHSLKLGSNSFIPGFEDQLTGGAAGQEVDVNVTFPEEYHDAGLAGKPVVFKVLVREVKESILPDLDDEFAKDVSEFDTLAELRENIKSRIYDQKKAALDADFEEQVMDGLLESFVCDIPEVMFDTQVSRLLQDFSYRLAAQGITMDNYLRISGMDRGAIAENMRPQAERQVKIRLALTAVAKKEGYEISDEDVEAEYTRLMDEYKMKLEEIKDYIPKDALKKDILVQKAADFVKLNAEIVEKLPEKKEKQEGEKKPRKRQPKKAAESKLEGETE